MTTFATVAITTVTCGAAGCGVHYGLDQAFIDARREDHKTFYCPNGHSRWYPPGSSQAEKERQRADRAERREANLQESLRIERAAVELQRRRAAAYKGHLTRMRNRIANGVCPCCSRSFLNVKRHMASQHPEAWARLEEASA